MDEQAVAENQALSFSAFVAAHEEGNLHHELSNDVRESTKKYLDEYLAAPERIRGVSRHRTMQSFVLHANSFKGETSVLFGNRDGLSIKAYYDYHAKDQPSHSTHQAEFKAEFSTQWNAWKACNGKKLSQSDFAEFIENNAMDLIDLPSGKSGVSEADRQILDIAAMLGFVIGKPSEIVKLARSIAVNEKSKVKSAINTSTGEVQIHYESEHQTANGQRLTVPSLFLIGIPIFDGDVADKVLVRLRYRMQEGSISWLYEMYRPDRIVDIAFAALAEQAKDGTGLTMFMGQSE